MEWTPEKLAKARALLSEDSAVLVQKGSVKFGTGTAGARRIRQKIVRQWPRISDGDRALCDAYLLEYASAANTTPGNIVHGPKTDRETFAGDWRMTRTDLSRIKTDSREQGCYQTLIFPADASDGPDGSFPSEETHLNHVHTTVSTGSAPAEIPCEVPPQGTRLSAAARLDKETGEWESEVRTDQARYQKWEYSDGDALATTKHTREEHADAPPSVPAPAPGKIVRANADIDEYATYRTQVDETTAIEKKIGPYTASQNALQSTTEESVRNAQSAPNAGDNESVSARVNEFGLVDYNKSKTTPKPKTINYTSQQTALETTTTESGRNADQAPEAGDNEAVNAHINEFGKVDYDKRSTTPKPKTINYTSQQTELETTTTESGRNADQAPNAGDNEAVNAHINEFGKVDYDKRSTTPKPKTINYTSQNTDLETTTTESGRNADEAPNAGDNEAVNAHINEFGKVDYDKRSTTPKPKTINYTSQQTALESTTTESVRNAGSAPSAGDNETVNAHINEYGLVDYEKRSTSPKPLTRNYNSAQNPARDIATEIGRNAGSIPSAEEHGTVTARINELGLVDYEKHTTTPKPLTDNFTSEYNEERTVKTEIGINAQKAPSAGKNETVSAHFNEHGLIDYTKHSIDEKGALGDGYSYSYYGPYTHGVKGKTTITSSKGWKRTLLQWGEWRYKYTVTVQKHSTIASARAALGSKTNVSGASITPGGTGIWYSHLTTVEKEWK